MPDVVPNQIELILRLDLDISDALCRHAVCRKGDLGCPAAVNEL